MMKKTLFLGFFIAVAGLVNAQRTELNWQNFETVDYQFTKKNYPKFTNIGYQADGSNVYFVQTLPSGNTGKTVANLVWQKVSAKDAYDLNTFQLPEKDTYTISQQQHPKTGEVTETVSVSAFKRENGEVYRLKSFDIISNNNPSARNLSAKSVSAKMPAQESPFKTGTFYKIKVDKSGIFKITTKFLRDNGINPSSINPKNFRIYGNGGLMLPEYNQDFRYGAPQEIAIQVVGEEDGKWDDGDYALFYAQGPHGFNVYKGNYSNAGRTETRTDASLHLQNIYEDNSYYFINFDIGAGNRIVAEDITPPADLITRYDDYQFIDEEKNNLQKVGRVWTGDAFTAEKTVSFKTKSAIRPEDEIYYRTSVVGLKSQSNSIKFNINGQKNYTTTLPNNAALYSKITDFKGTATNLSGNTINISITPDTSANPSGQFYFDYAEVVYKEDLKFNGGQMNFRDFYIDESSQNLYGFSVSDAGALEQVWNVTDIVNAKKIVNKSENTAFFNFGYIANSTNFRNEFVAFKNDAAYAPAFVGRIASQNLHGISGIDYLIITTADMLPQAQRIAEFHQNKEKFKTGIVDVLQIYNEYSSGSQDITAIRDFITELKNERGGLKYVLIIGDTSYDFKNRIAGNDNIVPSYHSEASNDYEVSYITDDYFVMTNTEKSSVRIWNNLPNLPIGRLPASNVREAKLMVDKTLAYNNALAGQSNPFGEWRMKLDFVADDDKDGGSPFHNVMNDALKDVFEQGVRTEYNIRKLYLDAFPQESTAGGQRYPQVNSAINSDMNNSLYMFYFGHGGVNGWAQERVLTLDDIKGINNYNSAYTRLPLVSTITCEFTLWDVPEVQSAGEQLFKLNTGGAATMITSSRAIAVTYGRAFTDTFTKRIFELNNYDFLPLGDAHLLAKYDYRADVNHLRVNFLGDPAMKLSRPKQDIVIKSVETPVNGQIRALDFVKVTGFVKDGSGNPDKNFNGRVSVNIFDKRLNKKTRNNDGGLTPVLDYTEEGSAIVKASGKVTNGEFTVEFYVPKDINYNLGDGRMLVYADNWVKDKRDAYDVFATQPVKIGGINPNGITDNQPPKVNLFMNNTNFADGGITNQNPMLLACISDDTGINSTGAGIGHDITVVLDGKVVETKVLNDFFTSGEGNGCTTVGADYQKGSVAYPFRNLEPGNHQIVFKIWDINNNSSTATLNFVVKSEADQNLTINRLLNWPNPFTSRTFIQFEHNCDDILDVNAQIYTITGKLVRTLSQTVVSEPFLQGFRTPKTAIEWDGKDDYGATVGKGTYIYKVFVKSQNQEKCKGSATGMEKAVILK